MIIVGRGADTAVSPGARIVGGTSPAAGAEVDPGPDPEVDPEAGPDPGPDLGAEVTAGGGATVKGAELAVRVSAAVAPVPHPAVTMTTCTLQEKKP